MFRSVSHTIALLVTLPLCGLSIAQAQQFGWTDPASGGEHQKPIVDYQIYRDYTLYPTDPRKPCNVCTQPPQLRTNIAGLQGRPYSEQEPGGCTCGNSSASIGRPCQSVFWPRPFSARLDERFPEQAANRYNGCPQRKLVDVFDGFKNFKLIDYARTDNGYTGSNCRGKGADPFGCLGQSQMFGSSRRLEVGQNSAPKQNVASIANSATKLESYPLFENQVPQSRLR